MSKWVVELEPGVWIANFDGDPGRAVILKNAQQFDNMQSAGKALTAAREYRPFKTAMICGVNKEPDNE